jgi:hypothetical protein
VPRKIAKATGLRVAELAELRRNLTVLTEAVGAHHLTLDDQ